jgi:uncharacterized membrane protein HdeD (DUF308 family)
VSFIGTPSAAEIGGRWKWYVVFGVVLAVLGVIALGNVVNATLITTIFVGWMLVFGGITQVMGAFMAGGSTGGRILALILGFLFILIGFNLVADPLRGTLTLTLAVALFLIADGIVRLISVFMGPHGHRVLEGAIGILNILLGVWLWTGFPISGLAIGFFVGLELLFAGISWIVAGFMSRSVPRSPATA